MEATSGLMDIVDPVVIITVEPETLDVPVTVKTAPVCGDTLIVDAEVIMAETVEAVEKLTPTEDAVVSSAITFDAVVITAVTED